MFASTMLLVAAVASAGPPPDLHPAPEGAAKPEPRLAATPPEADRPHRRAAYGLMAGGAAVLLMGGGLAVGAHDSTLLVTSARGAVFSQKLQLVSGEQTDALGADLAFVVGGLALASGLGLWLYGAQAAVVPTGTGVAVAGRF